MATATDREGRAHRLGAQPRVGMVGGGQLARMTLQAAIDLDIGLVVLTPDSESAAVAAGAEHFPGDPASRRDLRRLAAAVDVVTFDHELVPNEALLALEREGHQVRPRSAAKALAQDKLRARRCLDEAGIPVPAWAPAPDARAVERFAAERGWPVMLKARHGGYDGRGVWEVAGAADAAAICSSVDSPLIVEERVAIVRELAAVVARRPSGEAVAYPMLETVQREGICREVTAPAACPPQVEMRARELALTVANGVDAAGIVCMELFQTREGLLVNELAMRPHNSGHLTLDAFETSQFENHLRAVLDWPLGSTELTAPAAAMVNVLGAPDGSDPRRRLDRALEVPGARVRLYGKEPRPGRKLGHVSARGASVEQARARALEATAVLTDA